MLGKDPYHYQEFISDIAGQDIENHNNYPKEIVLKIRNWLSKIDKKKFFPSGYKIWTIYINFVTDNEL